MSHAGEDARGPNGARGPRASRPLPPAEAKGWHCRGYLPHFDSPEVVQVVTFRLADSLPKVLYDEITRDLDPASRRRRFNESLEQGRGGCTLREPEVAALVVQALKYFDGQRYRLFAWVVMPNHVHALLEPAVGHRLGSIVGCWKSVSAREVNRRSNLMGRFWAPDYYDRYVRDEAHFASAVRYIEENPVKAGLCSSADAWPYSSARRE